MTATSTNPTDSSGGGAPVRVNKPFTNAPLGESGVVLSYRRAFAVPASVKARFPALADEEVVLVRIRAQSSKKYYSSMGADSFYVIDDRGTPNSPTSVLDAQLTVAGYPPLKDAENGASTTGWVAFTPAKGSKHLTFVYRAGAATGSDGTSIASAIVKIKLV